MALKKSKLDKISILYPVLIGTKQIDSCNEKDYDIHLVGNIIQIVDKKTNDKAFTTIFNVKFFLSAELEY